MDRDDKGNSVILFGQNPPKVTVPGVTMDEIGIDVCSIEISTSSHGAEDRAQRLWTSKIARVELEANDLEVAFFKTLVAKATHFHRHHFRQFAREIVRMHTRPTVDVGRILVGEEENLHVGLYVVGAALVSSAESAERAFAAAHASGFTLPGRG